MHYAGLSLSVIEVRYIMDSMTAVAFIGVNSIEFARDEIIDLCGMTELGHLDVRLHDPDAGRLRHAEAVGETLARQRQAAMSVRACAELAEALAGASYVVCEIEPGGIKAQRLDFEVPARYGVRQSVADTIGIGGIFRGLRTLPVMADIARQMVVYCPDAYLLSYTNPMVTSIWMACQATGMRRVYGLCHAVPSTHALLASVVGIDEAELEFVTAGFNHQAFVLKFAREGRSAYPLLAARLRDEPGLVPPVSAELFRRFGYFPTQRQAEYLPWVMRHDSELRRLSVVLDQHEQAEQETLRGMAVDSDFLTAGTRFTSDPQGTLAPRFMHAIETGARREMYLSMRNDGLIDNVPADCCVEVPALVGDVPSGHGPSGTGHVSPVPVGALPVQLAALNRTFLNVAELTVRAVLDECRDHVYHAALLDPNTAATLPAPRIAALCDEMLAAQRDLIPVAIAG
jgi:alpha-galactosidase